MADKRQHYVYIYYRLNGVPLYVGQGKGGRWRRHLQPARKKNEHLWAVVQQARRVGRELPVTIFRSELSVQESIELEQRLIEWIGREVHGGPLVNQTDRAGGTPGWKPTREWREKRSAAAKLMWADPEIRARLVAVKIGQPGRNVHARRTAEWSAKISISLEGNQRTLGYKHRDESREKMRARWQDPERRAREMQRRRDSGMYGEEAVARRAAKRIANNTAKKIAAD